MMELHTFIVGLHDLVAGRYGAIAYQLDREGAIPILNAIQRLQMENRALSEKCAELQRVLDDRRPHDEYVSAHIEMIGAATGREPDFMNPEWSEGLEAQVRECVRDLRNKVDSLSLDLCEARMRPRDHHETQQTVTDWARTTFGIPTADKCADRLKEEVSELLVEFSVNSTWEEILEECADVVICMYSLARACGADLMAEVDRKMAINRVRKWRSNNDGTGQHLPTEDTTKCSHDDDCPHNGGPDY